MSDPAPSSTVSGDTDPKFFGENYKHGIDPAVVTALEAIGIAVTEFNPDGEPEFMSMAEGPLGMVTAIARCKQKKLTVNVSGFILDEEDFEAADSFEISGRLFIIGKDGKKFKGGEFAKADFTATSWPLITS